MNAPEVSYTDEDGFRVEDEVDGGCRCGCTLLAVSRIDLVNA